MLSAITEFPENTLEKMNSAEEPCTNAEKVRSARKIRKLTERQRRNTPGDLKLSNKELIGIAEKPR